MIGASLLPMCQFNDGTVKVCNCQSWSQSWARVLRHSLEFYSPGLGLELCGFGLKFSGPDPGLEIQCCQV